MSDVKYPHPGWENKHYKGRDYRPRSDYGVRNPDLAAARSMPSRGQQVAQSGGVGIGKEPRNVRRAAIISTRNRQMTRNLDARVAAQKADRQNRALQYVLQKNHKMTPDEARKRASDPRGVWVRGLKRFDLEDPDRARNREARDAKSAERHESYYDDGFGGEIHHADAAEIAGHWHGGQWSDMVESLIERYLLGESIEDLLEGCSMCGKRCEDPQDDLCISCQSGEKNVKPSSTNRPFDVAPNSAMASRDIGPGVMPV